jgi:hypothetical protein
LGLTENEVARDSERFANHARSTDRRLSDWSMGWRNWMLKAAEFLGREAPKGDHEPCQIGFHAKADSDELCAWEDYRMRIEGRGYPRDGRGGWTFPTQWPPDFVPPADRPAPQREAAE